MKRVALLSMLLVPATMTLGCIIHPTEDSCNVLTPGIYNEYNVTQSNNGALVQAKFWVGNVPGGTVLSLGQCNDRIEVNGVVLNETGSNYEARLPLAAEYVFTFTREGQEPYVSRVSLPPEVTITAPTIGTTIERDKGFDITWESNASGSLNLEVSGSCISTYPDLGGEDVADNGLHSVPTDGIKATVLGKDETCEATVKLTRTLGGVLDARLKGTIKSKTDARTSFNSAPASSAVPE